MAHHSTRPAASRRGTRSWLATLDSRPRAPFAIVLPDIPGGPPMSDINFDHPPRRMPNDTGRRVAENLLHLPEQSSGSVFAMRWTKFDVIARIVVLVAIAIVPIVSTYKLEATMKGTE